MDIGNLKDFKKSGSTINGIFDAWRGGWPDPIAEWYVGKANVGYGASPYYYSEDSNLWRGRFVNSAVSWLNIIDLNPNIFSSGSQSTINIRANFLGVNFVPQEFNPKSTEYVRILNQNGDDITCFNPDAQPGDEDRIKIINQKFINYFTNDPKRVQKLEIEISVGAKVPSGLYDVDILLGEIHAYPDELSKQYAGANGAHRMKEALMIVGVDLQ